MPLFSVRGFIELPHQPAMLDAINGRRRTFTSHDPVEAPTAQAAIDKLHSQLLGEWRKTEKLKERFDRDELTNDEMEQYIMNAVPVLKEKWTAKEVQPVPAAA